MEGGDTMRKEWTQVIILLIFVFSSIASGSEPLSSVKISIPDYKVNKVANLDYVEIPEGEILLAEEGRPRVPYYTQSIDYPDGYRVQDVILKKKAGLRTATGLKLPVVILNPQLKSYPKMKEGWYPEEEYEWKVWDNPDGSATLVIIVYPFYYNPTTTDVKFYKNYQFDIKYTFSSVSIISVATDRNVYDPGDNIKADVNLNNNGKALDITLTATIKKEGTDELVYSLPTRSLEKLSGDASLSLEWNTKGTPTGNYLFEIKLSDVSGNILDKRSVAFRLGNPLGEITEFKVEPQHFKIGDKIKFSLEFENTGSCELGGECVFKIRKAKKVLKESSHEFTKLAPGKSLHFKDTWDTKDAEKGAIYYIFSYVRYEGTATLAEHAVASTNLFPTAKFNYSPEKPVTNEEITFDASSSTDADGKIVEFGWEFGDGGTAEGMEVTHAYSLPGDYKVILVVTDNEGATNITKETMSVKE